MTTPATLPDVPAFARPLGAAVAGIDRAARLTLMVLMTIMIVVVSAQVFLRYVLNSSIGWADEVSRLAFVWSVFLAIPLGIREGLHVGIELLTSHFPDLVRRGLVRLMALFGAVMMVIVAWQSAIIAYDQWDEKMASVPASAGLFVVAIVIGSAHAALCLLWIAATGRSRETTSVALTE